MKQEPSSERTKWKKSLNQLIKSKRVAMVLQMNI